MDKIKKRNKLILKIELLVCLLIGLFVNFSMSGKTYAYESNQFSNTLTPITYNNQTYYEITNISFKDTFYKYILMNWSSTGYGSWSTNIHFYDNEFNNISNLSGYWQNSQVNNPKTRIFEFTTDLVNDAKYISIGSLAPDFQVINIDIVNATQITTTIYYDTYISQLENQISQLQDNYDTLQDNYDTLQDNYDTLQDNYDSLQDNYDTLTGDYNYLLDYLIFNDRNITRGEVYNNGVQYNYVDYPLSLTGNGLSISTGELLFPNTYINNDMSLNEVVYQLYFDNIYSISGYEYFTGLSRFRDERMLINFYLDNKIVQGVDFDNDSETKSNYDVFSFNHIEIRFQVTFYSIDLLPYRDYQNGLRLLLSYSQGYQDGINNLKEQVDNAYDYGYENGYQDGLEVGVEVGYDNGFNEGTQQDFASSGFSTLLNSILSYPVNMISSVFNFNFMGVNIASLILFIVSIGIVIFVIKKFI